MCWIDGARPPVDWAGAAYAAVPAGSCEGPYETRAAAQTRLSVHIRYHGRDLPWKTGMVINAANRETASRMMRSAWLTAVRRAEIDLLEQWRAAGTSGRP